MTAKMAGVMSGGGRGGGSRPVGRDFVFSYLFLGVSNYTPMGPKTRIWGVFFFGGVIFYFRDFARIHPHGPGGVSKLHPHGPKSAASHDSTNAMHFFSTVLVQHGHHARIMMRRRHCD